MAKNKMLRGLIYQTFDTESDCAKALGWNRQQLNKITNNKKKPTVDELNELAKVSNTNVETIFKFFLPS